MHFFKALLFCATAVSAVAVIERDVAETKANLADIDAKTRQLTSTVQGWDGSGLGAFTINSNEQDLEKSIDNAISKAADETQANSADSRSVIGYVTGTLEPDIQKSLDALVAKKSQFQKAGLAGTVHDALTRLRSKSASLSDSLIRIASSDQKSNGQAAKTRIDNRFAAALQQFP